MVHAGKSDLPKATGLTMAICGVATLALAMVLGVSLASGAANVPGDEPVTIVIRPPATDTAVLAGTMPFDMASCTTTMAARR